MWSKCYVTLNSKGQITTEKGAPLSETYRETLGILVSIKLSTRYNVALSLLTKRLKIFNEIEDVLLMTIIFFFQASAVDVSLQGKR